MGVTIIMKEFTEFVCFNLKATNKRVEKYMTSFFENIGINVSQSFILQCLLYNNGCTLSEISVRAQIENSSLTTMADKLERLGLVERKSDPQNRRVIRLFLTASGKELAEKVQSSGEEFDRYLRNVLGEDMDKLFDSLNQISASISQCSAETDQNNS
jgi:MarR family transcriptional regulator, organic hydroperoxide resistance regulator